jgi:hypothetical protein
MGKAKRLKAQRTQALVGSSPALPVNARSFELKIARAQQHLQHVNEQVRIWTETTLQTLSEESDTDDPRYQCAWIDTAEIDLQLLSLRVGDSLQCLRSGLDHLALELATAFTIPMTDVVEHGSEFPIHGDVDRHGNLGAGPSKWKSTCATKVGGMAPNAQAAIEALQPYHRGQAFDQDPLWRLAVLNNIDKHRILHVTSRVMQGAALPTWNSWVNVAYIGLPGDEVSTITVGGDFTPEGRTQVARWAAQPRDPQQEMRVGFSPVLNVIFDPATPLVGDQSVIDVLREIQEHIQRNVLPPLVGFLK